MIATVGTTRQQKRTLSLFVRLLRCRESEKIKRHFTYAKRCFWMKIYFHLFSNHFSYFRETFFRIKISVIIRGQLYEYQNVYSSVLFLFYSSNACSRLQRRIIYPSASLLFRSFSSSDQDVYSRQTSRGTKGNTRSNRRTTWDGPMLRSIKR